MLYKKKGTEKLYNSLAIGSFEDSSDNKLYVLYHLKDDQHTILIMEQEEFEEKFSIQFGPILR
jgi:hypothetical protein